MLWTKKDEGGGSEHQVMATGSGDLQEDACVFAIVDAQQTKGPHCCYLGLSTKTTDYYPPPGSVETMAETILSRSASDKHSRHHSVAIISQTLAELFKIRSPTKLGQR
ncbi:hypothetical protein [Massilia sp. YMA4]|uniref:hypothetical protein n=1 Tax=Massilia sp. YMA4 TaxID=1593482 RepID=UPI001D0C079B|nr:hypothetical protein [Massilia sp. YMA4]